METLRKKLYFKSHHMGMKENDKIFGTFAENYLNTLSEQDLKDYDILLQENDLLLYKSLTKQIVIPTHLHTNLYKKLMKHYETFIN